MNYAIVSYAVIMLAGTTLSFTSTLLLGQESAMISPLV